YAGLLQLAGDRDGALAQYGRLLAERPDDPLPLNEVALLYQAAGDPRAAATAEKAYRLAPQSAMIADTFGWILLQQGDTERSISLLRQAASAGDAVPPAVHYHLAVALDKAGQHEEAKRVLGDLLQSSASFEERPQAQQLMQKLGG